MTYAVKEIFYTLQGEGTHTGRPAVFCRFSGCNLWSGRESDRVSAICKFCDTAFVGVDGDGGGQFASVEDLAEAIAKRWPINSEADRFVVFTGGEPLLQLDDQLVTACHQRGFEVAVETNGTIEAIPDIDWICVSPKAGAPLHQRSGHELKLVFPQAGLDPADFEHLNFTRFYLQPMDGPSVQSNIAGAVAYCLAHPKWRLSVQNHKFLGLR